MESRLVGAILAGIIFMLSVSAAPAQQEQAILEMQQQIRGTQRDYNDLKAPITSRVIDRRFRTKEAMYLANEEILSGNEFMLRALEKGLPVAEDADFINITTNESYWYSRYNLSNLISKSRMGIHVVHGPYVTLRALGQQDYVFYNRDRGERDLANREVVLRQLIPIYLARTGFSRRFEDASPLVIEFASGDPRLTRALDKNDDFEGGNGQVDYEDTYLTLRWNHDKMDKTIDMGAVGQTLVKQVLWAEYFFSQNHDGGKLLGNTPEDGFRGCMLNLMMVSKMLLLKASLFYDGKRLGGINPLNYDPEKELRYLPHLIYPHLILAGDIPPRPHRYHVKDPSSQLFDQASMLWGLSEYAYFSDPEINDNWDSVFGDTFPYDGSVMELKWRYLAQKLADVIFQNIDSMHRDPDSGGLVSEWHPKTKHGTIIHTPDLAMTLVALANYAKRVATDETLTERAHDLIASASDFLIEKLQRDDGAFLDSYDLQDNTALGQNATLLSQGFAIRGLLKAHQALDRKRYLEAARGAYQFMVDELWHPTVRVFRSEEHASESIYTPMNLGAALGAMREWILATKDIGELRRYKEFHVQALSRSGIMLAEEGDTGETDLSLSDGDGDGLKRFEFAGGRYGTAAVHASKVLIETPLEGIASAR
ncbi:MAG: hypothetical protein V3U98_02380 [Acidobacteriota bacterium]